MERGVYNAGKAGERGQLVNSREKDAEKEVLGKEDKKSKYS